MTVEWTNSDSLTTTQTTKAVLVFDMPNRCWECPIHYLNICEVNQYKVGWENGRNGKPEWCPLRPLPQKNKYDVEKYATVDYENDITLGHYLNKGWNDCLDEITGETNHE